MIEYYLLNALWVGVLIVVIMRNMGTIFHVVKFVIVMCLPFGIVAGWHTLERIVKAVRNYKPDE